MPSGREVHLGFPTAEKAWAWADRIGLPIADEDGAIFTMQEWLEDPTEFGLEIGTSRFEDHLRAAFLDTIQEMEWRAVEGSGHYVKVSTPWGDRQAGVWNLNMLYDPGEIGDDPEDLSIGVNLSSRYFPAILDMQREHGTLGTIVLDQEFMHCIEVCRRNLLKHIPELEGAEIYVREIWY